VPLDRQSWRGPLLASLLVFAGCEAADHGVARESEGQGEAEPAGVVGTASENTCEGNAVASRLPTAAAIAGMNRGSRRCDWLLAEVDYEGGGHSCRLTLTDMQAQIPADLQARELLPVAQLTLQMASANHRTPIEMGFQHRDLMLQARADLLEMMGGVEVLPVVGRLPDGGRYVIQVPPQGQSDEGVLIAIAGDDRHGITIHCSQQVTGASSAEALFAPWIPHLALGASR
jgi:hypothetical protein